MKQLLILLFAFLFIASCTLEEAEEYTFTTGTADFSRYVAVGGSITAGFQSSALTSTHQQYSYPALLARQAGTDEFVQPLIEYPGLGNFTAFGGGILELNSLFPLSIVPVQYSNEPGFNPESPFTTPELANRVQPFHNLGIPGVILPDLLVSKTTEASFSRALMIDIILKNTNKPAGSQKTVVGQVKELDPTFVTCLIGLSDVLGYALSGGISENLLTTEQDFESFYAELLDSLSANGADLAVANIPNVGDIAYFTTVPPYLINIASYEVILDDDGERIPLVGVGTNDLVLLSAIDTLARGTGVPVDRGGNGEPLPDVFFLDQEEINVLISRISAFNGIIDQEASARNIPVIDLNTYLFNVSESGISLPGAQLTASFVTGGFFSLDGLHPTDVGNALIANLWIDTINDHYGAQIPPVNIVDITGQ